jgi:predicted phosphohydrolase
MKLHVLSDLHLTVSAFDAPSTDADVVVLAGDVARPDQAIAWARSLDKPVIYVSGNHEYYDGSIDGTIARLKALAAGSSIHVLEHDAVVLGGVRFVGTTLWTDFLLFGDGAGRALAIQGALDFLRDFSRIRRDDAANERFTPSDAASLFARNASWLEHTLAQDFDGPTVVVTHHAPSPRSIHPRFAESVLNPCFVSNAERLLGGDRVALWIHGHAHDSFDYAVKGTRVVCNPRGYAKHDAVENRRFDPRLVIDIRELDAPPPGT